MKKYSDILTQIVLNVKEDDAADYLDAFLELLKQDGVILNIENIIKEAQAAALRGIDEMTVTLRKSREDGGETLVLRQKLGERFFVEEKLDESLIAGVAIDFYGSRIESSLSGRLETLTGQMKT